MSKYKIYDFFRYFKGEEECPFRLGDESNAWFLEQVYAIKGADACSSEALQRYGVADLFPFREDDGIPIKFKAFAFYKLFEYGSLFDAIEPFKKFINRTYPID